MRLAVPAALLPLVLVPQAWAAGDSRAWPLGLALYVIAIAVWASLGALPHERLAGGVRGVAAGLLIAYLLTPVVHALAVAPFGVGDTQPGRALLTVALYFAVAIIGGALGAGGAVAQSTMTLKPSESRASGTTSSGARVCDTSVLIDGRIVEMAEAGFIDGELVIPQFILGELQAIADSSDPLRRNRGRRGLDVVKKMQEIRNVTVTIPTVDYADEREVDNKLLRLAADRDAALITNDLNLNKVARVRGLRVLNLNDLVNALKTIHLPGEELTLPIARTGKEPGQGVGFLDDGTMIVVDGGGTHIGKTVRVVVTNIHQTTAGRMIFTRFEAVTGRGRGESAEKN